MGHSSKPKVVTKKFDLFKYQEDDINDYYDIAAPGAKPDKKMGIGYSLDNKYVMAFCAERFERAMGIKLRRGEVAEMTITITRKK